MSCWRSTAVTEPEHLKECQHCPKVAIVQQQIAPTNELHHLCTYIWKEGHTVKSLSSLNLTSAVVCLHAALQV